MSLIKCKECGKEISSEAEVCPHCGKKIDEGNMFSKLVGILVILGAIGSIFDNDKPKNASTVSIPAEQIVFQKVNIGVMDKQLKENAARAQQKYQGMYVEFQGVLDIIDANGKYFTVSLNDSFLAPNILCNISDEQQKQVLISKSKGNIISVKGKIKRVGEMAGFHLDVIELK